MLSGARWCIRSEVQLKWLFTSAVWAVLNQASVAIKPETESQQARLLAACRTARWLRLTMQCMRHIHEAHWPTPRWVSISAAEVAYRLLPTVKSQLSAQLLMSHFRNFSMFVMPDPIADAPAR